MRRGIYLSPDEVAAVGPDYALANFQLGVSKSIFVAFFTIVHGTFRNFAILGEKKT